MEKYATDLNSIPPTADQIRTIKKMGGDPSYVKTSGEANIVIQDLYNEKERK